MKPMLSKEEVEQLDDQQLEAYVNVVKATEREHRTLLETASSYRGRWSSGVVFLLIFIAVSLLDLTPTTGNTILCIAVFIVVHVHSTGLNRRIDSVLRLQQKAEEERAD